MEALARFHHHLQPLGSSVNYYCPSLRRSISSHFLSPSPPLSSSIRASSSPTPSSSEPSRPNFQNSRTPSSQYLDPFPKFPSFASLTAALALLLLGFCRKVLVEKPTMLSPMATIQELIVEEGEIERLLGSRPIHVHSMRYLKLKEKIPVVHDFTKIRPDDQAWQVLNSQVFSCSEELELVKIRFEEILEKDPYCNKSYHSRILEYLEMVDECKVLLKDIKLAMDRFERENGDMKYYLRFFNNLIDRIRVLVGDMLGALKYFQELEQEYNGEK